MSLQFPGEYRNSTMCNLWAAFNTVTPPIDHCDSMKVKLQLVNLHHPPPLGRSKEGSLRDKMEVFYSFCMSQRANVG